MFFWYTCAITFGLYGLSTPMPNRLWFIGGFLVCVIVGAFKEIALLRATHPHLVSEKKEPHRGRRRA